MNQKKYPVLQKKIGLNIAIHRTKKGWTTATLSRKTSIGEKKIQLYELGQTNFKFEVLHELSNSLNCDIKDFL